MNTKQVKTKTYAMYNNLPYAIINGKYGKYIVIGNRVNISEKNFQEVKQLTTLDYNEIWSAYNEKLVEAQRVYQLQKLAEREEQIDICLASTPLTIGEGNGLFNSITPIVGGMREAYHGCGKITAYIKEGLIVAFHYGYDQPLNVPSDAQAIRCEVSCFEILF